MCGIVAIYGSNAGYKELFKAVKISPKEEFYYFRIFKSFFNTDGEIEALGRWNGGFALEGADL